MTPAPRRFATQAEALLWMLEHGAGQALHLVVLHDDGCLHSRTHACTCTPEFVVEDMTPGNLVRGQREQEAWLNRHERN